MEREPDEVMYGIPLSAIPHMIVPASEVTTYEPVMHDLFCVNCDKKTEKTFNGVCEHCWQEIVLPRKLYLAFLQATSP